MGIVHDTCTGQPKRKFDVRRLPDTNDEAASKFVATVTDIQNSAQLYRNATSSFRHSLNNPSRVARSGVVAGHGRCAHAGRSAEADVTSSSEDKLGDRFSTAGPLSVALGSWPHRYGPAELDFPDTVTVRRRGWTAS